jgi:hypothetical protein
MDKNNIYFKQPHNYIGKINMYNGIINNIHVPPLLVNHYIKVMGDLVYLIQTDINNEPRFQVYDTKTQKSCHNSDLYNGSENIIITTKYVVVISDSTILLYDSKNLTHIKSHFISKTDKQYIAAHNDFLYCTNENTIDYYYLPTMTHIGSLVFDFKPTNINVSGDLMCIRGADGTYIYEILT